VQVVSLRIGMMALKRDDAGSIAADPCAR